MATSNRTRSTSHSARLIRAGVLPARARGWGRACPCALALPVPVPPLPPHRTAAPAGNPPGHRWRRAPGLTRSRHRAGHGQQQPHRVNTTAPA
ncbi:hypothetical protein [Limnohabitans planktonicus]|uniref:hypothetical protein n=1 Tax=Limnohabitans planktonicus TaxID=540060 RepID=UPI000AB8D50D|nr:hypothetical protein [Limnohabitans planktonicus]